jgi:hypothetical protein
LRRAESIVNDEIRGCWLPAFYNSIAARDFEAARSAATMLAIHVSNAERKLVDVRAEHPTGDFLARLEVVEGLVMAVRTEVDAALRLAPPKAESTGDDRMLYAHGACAPEDPGEIADTEAQAADEWSSQMDAHEESAWRAAEQTADSSPIREDRSEPVGSAQPDAVSGIHLMIQAPPLPSYDQILDEASVGPSQAGPYRFQPHTRERKLVYFVAFHRERQQQEWVIGPDSIDYFAQNVDLFVGAARNAYPGSKNIPATQKDGADKAQHPASLLELEAFGAAPWQRTFGGGSLADKPGPMDGGVPTGPDPFAIDLIEGHEHTRGGPAMVGLRNGEIRIHDYAAEAERLAKELQQQLSTGTIGHTEARTRAVDGRNHTMRQVRERLSPGAAYASRQIKSDSKVDAGAMAAKKTVDIMDSAAGHPPPKESPMGVLGMSGDADALRSVLAQDSELWAEYLAKLETGGDARLVYQDAVERLGAQPAVSRAIVNSSGKTNKFVTGIARFSRPLEGGLAVYGLYEMVSTIAGAEAGERAHVAAGELAGFTGGVVGAEVGAMSAVWLASLLIPNPSTPAIIIVSIIGGGVGGSVGAEMGRTVLGATARGAQAAGTAMFGPGMAQNGGYNGLYERSMDDGMNANRIEQQLADAVFAKEQELREIEARIAESPDRGSLRKLWAQRLAVLDQRDELDRLYGALRIGAIDERAAWEMTGGMQPEERDR